MAGVKHKYTSAIADVGDPTLVQPSNWNDDHVQLRTLSADAVLPANSSTIIVGDYEIAAGFTLELAADANMEIS